MGQPECVFGVIKVSAAVAKVTDKKRTKLALDRLAQR